MHIFLVLLLRALPPAQLDQVIEQPAMVCPVDPAGNYLDQEGA